MSDTKVDAQVLFNIGSQITCIVGGEVIEGTICALSENIIEIETTAGLITIRPSEIKAIQYPIEKQTKINAKGLIYVREIMNAASSSYASNTWNLKNANVANPSYRLNDDPQMRVTSAARINDSYVFYQNRPRPDSSNQVFQDLANIGPYLRSDPLERSLVCRLDAKISQNVETVEAKLTTTTIDPA